MAKQGHGWIAVRMVIATPWEEGERCYEERITLWRSDTFEQALAKAEREANDYAAQWSPPAEVLDLEQAYRLFDPPGEGVEVFSLIRDSELPSDAYVDRYFDTGRERQGILRVTPE